MRPTDAELQRLADESAIREVMYRYCRAIDRRQYDDLRSCYHEQGTDHHGDFYGGVDEFIDYVQERLPNFESSMHFVGNLYIEVNGDTARSEAYTLALAHLAATDEQPERDNLVALRYVDDFRRINGRWAIMHRKCVYEWTRTDPTPPGWTFTDFHLRGQPNRNDTIYQTDLSDIPNQPDTPEIRAL